VRVAIAPNQPQDAGRTLGEIARRRRVDPLDAVCDFLIADRGATRILITSMSEKDVYEITGTPWVLVGSDANALATSGVTSQGKPHPRSYGTHARLLGTFVRDLGLLSLPAAACKTTGASARPRARRSRRLAGGSWADVTVFDRPHRRARDFDDPHQYSVGVHGAGERQWCWTAATTRAPSRTGAETSSRDTPC
jgi:N-acyl-D-amino-acid deacylase